MVFQVGHDTGEEAIWMSIFPGRENTGKLGIKTGSRALRDRGPTLPIQFNFTVLAKISAQSEIC